MLDHLLLREAFRARLLTLVVATTGTTNLEATATGYARPAGSFVTDGFLGGMEVVGAGFSSANNSASLSLPPAILETVVVATPLVAKVKGGRTIQAVAGARTLSVGIPLDRRWAGTQTPEVSAPATRPNIVEQWVPGLTEDDGGIVDTGFAVYTWNGLANYGIATMLRQMAALRNHFPPGLSFTVNSDIVRITGKPAPQFTQPITTDNGLESSTFRIPWRVMTTNLDPV